ncbi:MAG TPA: isoprenylcysteine carboxylmethyltransferase family protein [Vicinamibacterales bacterium]|nr:isoprenylcysteine carboxylmethyltransferase family protein [Vicinamibacterales bacterium]
MGRFIALLFGLASYAVFLGTFLYAIGFVSGIAVPKDIDTGPEVRIDEAVSVNLLLLTLFAMQHSIMARKGFKRWWTQIVPPSIERSVYVLLASLMLIVLFWQWQPIPMVVWEVSNPVVAQVIQGISLLGWGVVLISTLLINHFELFGLRQVFANLTRRPLPGPEFRTPSLYRVVRHPLYLGFLIAFWAAPTMTLGHLMFAVVTTAYILIAIGLEERDLIDAFGEEYREYRQRVAMIIPFLR